MTTAREVHAAHADFVWATLHRLGVPRGERADVMQEVFLVVHRRIDSFDGSSKVTTWLFGICLRVVSAWRRRHRRRPEAPAAEATELHDGRTPEAEAETREARAEVHRALDLMDLEKRAVFVMFELEDLPCAEIAAVMGVPVGTVHSRLYAARAAFADAVRAGRKAPR